MADNDDTLGCVLYLGGAIAIGLYVWNNYEIRKVDSESSALSASVMRPVGRPFVTSLPDGTVWLLDADSVLGPRDARLAWLIEDHTKNKSAKSNETKTLYKINCNTTAYHSLQIVNYDKKGHVLDSWGEKDLKKEDDYPPPGSVIATFVNAACNKGFGDKPAPDGPEPYKN